MGFKLPFPFANRSFVVVGYLSHDPVTNALLYVMFSHNNQNDIDQSKPSGVLGEINAAFMVTPTVDGCKLVMYSRCDLKSSSLGAFANTLSKQKPKMVHTKLLTLSLTAQEFNSLVGVKICQTIVTD